MKVMTSGKDGGVAGIYGSCSKITKHKRDVENEEIRAHLSKLKELVPFTPKNRRLSKLEVIQHAIDYICDLQHALETHPTICSVTARSAAAAAATAAAAAAVLSSTSQVSRMNLQMIDVATAPIHRQPLAILPPNAIAKTLHIRSTCFASAPASASISTLETSSISSSSRQNEIVSYSSDGSNNVTC